MADQPSAPATPPTPILYLDADDEITSAAARIRGVAGGRVALVVPFGSRLATSRINFRLLAREASERGKAIEIVAADASARALAASAGLPVHPSVAAFEGRVPAGAAGTPAIGATNGHEPSADAASNARATPDDAATEVLAIPADPTTHRGLAKPRDRTSVPLVGPARPPVRTSVIAGVVVALAMLLVISAWAAVAVLPSATISLAPRSDAAGPLDLTVQARTDVTAPDAGTLVIPARRFSFDLEATDTFPATGVKVTESKATGSVTFANFDTGGGVLIPAGTIVRTKDRIEFATLAEVTLPRATFDLFPPFAVHPSTSSVGVEAVVAGVTGNVGNNAIVDVPKARNTLTVTNPDATSGGGRTESPQVSQADVDAALAALEGQLRAQLTAIAVAPPGVPPGTELFGETAVVDESEPSADPASIVGTEAAEFELGMTGTGSVLGVDPAPLETVAEERLEDRVPAGWQIADGSIEVAVGEPSVFGDTVTFPVTVGATQVRVVDRDALLQEIRGLTRAEARVRLAAYGDVTIELWPGWVANVPGDVSKVTLTILEPRPAASPSPPPPSGAAPS